MQYSVLFTIFRRFDVKYYSQYNVLNTVKTDGFDTMMPVTCIQKKKKTGLQQWYLEWS